MNEMDAWQAFLHSGSIYDYLIYKSIHNDLTNDKLTEQQNEDYNQRTDNQGTEYR